ncbi:MAG TPA: TraB/GumN family protein [Candidatus Binatia bacterium]
MTPNRLRRVVIGLAIFFAYTSAVHFPFQIHSHAAENRPLWKVRAKNNVVYLLGSIHYLKRQNYPLDRAMEAAFEDAKKVVFEIDLESAGAGEKEQLMVLKGVYADGTTLKDHVAPSTYALAEKQLKALGLDIQIFNQFEPWLTALTVLGLKLQAMGFDPGQGVDRYFFRKAKKERKETHGFETLEYQLGLFDGLPERVQEALLLQSLGEADLTEAAVDAVVKAWASGDLKTLDALLLQGMRDYPDLYRTLIVDRNRAWLPKIESYLSHNENYLVVVGAAHLAGKDGLIEMLKAKGYAVEQ